MNPNIQYSYESSPAKEHCVLPWKWCVGLGSCSCMQPQPHKGVPQLLLRGGTDAVCEFPKRNDLDTSAFRGAWNCRKTSLAMAFALLWEKMLSSWYSRIRMDMLEITSGIRTARFGNVSRISEVGWFTWILLLPIMTWGIHDYVNYSCVVLVSSQEIVWSGVSLNRRVMPTVWPLFPLMRLLEQTLFFTFWEKPKWRVLCAAVSKLWRSSPWWKRQFL